MTRKLVIHIGAQKCASSSLQSSLGSLAVASAGKLDFCFLDGKKLLNLKISLLKGSGEGDWSYVDSVFDAFISPQAVISQEMLGNNPFLVGSIAKRALKRFNFDEVVIAGYTRRQSDYQVSAFNQWFFRDQKVVQADINVCLENQLPWSKFSSLERNLLALILVGKDRSWHADYSGLMDNVQTLAGAVRVVSNHIPTRKQPYGLLENFLDITDLALEIDDVGQFNSRENIAFNPLVVHAMSHYYSELGSRQSCFPGPHEGNKWISNICRRLNETNLEFNFEEIFPSSLITALLDCLDWRTYSDNANYCNLMSVSPSFFSPPQREVSFDSADVLESARYFAEARQRRDIEKFQRDVENAFMKAVHDEIANC